jgi:hypothetical protein
LSNETAILDKSILPEDILARKFIFFKKQHVLFECSCHTRQGHPHSTIFGEENSPLIKENMPLSDETAIDNHAALK